MVTLTGEYIVQNIKKRTKAQLFTDLSVGDRVIFSVKLKHPGKGRNMYATYIKTNDPKRNVSTANSFAQLGNILECFDLTNST